MRYFDLLHYYIANEFLCREIVHVLIQKDRVKLKRYIVLILYCTEDH